MKPLFRSPTGGATLGHVPGSEFHNQRGTHLHAGIDLNAPMGYPITAPRRGSITVAALSSGLGGNMVVIDHGILRDGKHHVTRHFHFGPKHSPWQDVIAVRAGQRVKGGQLIGWCGTSGNANAPHDHYEHHVNGRPVDPLHYLKEYQVIRRFLLNLRLALFYPRSEGVDVAELQRRLNRHGYGPLAVDGIYGPLTRLEVEAFQLNRGLVVDGIVGKLTWRCLL